MSRPASSRSISIGHSLKRRGVNTSSECTMRTAAGTNHGQGESVCVGEHPMRASSNCLPRRVILKWVMTLRKRNSNSSSTDESPGFIQLEKLLYVPQSVPSRNHAACRLALVRHFHTPSSSREPLASNAALVGSGTDSVASNLEMPMSGSQLNEEVPPPVPLVMSAKSCMAISSVPPVNGVKNGALVV